MIKIFCAVTAVLIVLPSHADETNASTWTNESEAAIVKTSGNSETESYSIKQSSSKKVELNTYSAKGSYLKTAAENKTTGSNEETARKWDVGARYERAIDEKWSAFLAYFLESDKYAGYQQKHNTDVGGKYIIYKNEKQTWVGEAGYRYVHQNNVNSTQKHGSAARAYLEANYKINETNSAKASVEYVPNFDESKDYQVKSEVSLSSAISTMFSLKVAYETKTDNLPEPGAEKTDTKLTTALVAKF